MASLGSAHTATKLLRESSAQQPAEDPADSEKDMHRDYCSDAHPANQFSASIAEQPANQTPALQSTNAQRRSKSEGAEKKKKGNRQCKENR